jgi:peptidoglycan/xylan/chitin deacetylase (PgdA/CDA1 family)
LAHAAGADIGKAVAITFDDGPGPLTEEVLDILRDQGVRATFFQVGRMIERNPTILRRIRDEQHVLGNHSFSHPVLTGRDRGQLVRTQRLIRRLGGFDTCLFRAPYGENPRPVVELARKLSMVTVHWNVDPGDWRGLSAARMVATSLEQTRPGSILVFHDGEDHPDMVAGLPRLLSSLKKRGYRFLTVPELLGLPLRYR